MKKNSSQKDPSTSVGMTMVRLSSVSLTRDGKAILRDISWEIKQGEHWALIGANGSGKTKLLKIITGYEWPTSGVVEVLGKKFGEVDLRELRKEIGWVSSDLQQRLQQNFTAEEVVLSGYFASIGLYDKSPKLLRSLKEKAKSLMNFMEIAHLADRMFPLLSFGEQKRVMIARALISDPKLLILDEPATGLDLKAREEFLPFIDQLGKKKDGPTIIMTTHHIEEIMPVISHVVALKKGKVVKQGRKEEILTEENINEIFNIKLSLHHQNGRFWMRG